MLEPPIPRRRAGPGMRSRDDPAVPARIGVPVDARTCPLRIKNCAKLATGHGAIHPAVTPLCAQVDCVPAGLARPRVEALPDRAEAAGLAARDVAPPAFLALASVLARGLEALLLLATVDLPPEPDARAPRPPVISRSARCQCSSCLPCGRPSASQISWARCSMRLCRSDLIRLSLLGQRPGLYTRF